MVHKQHYSPWKTETLKYQDTDTVVLTNKKSPPLEDIHYMKVGGMWNLQKDTNLTKIIWTTNKYQIERRHCSVPQ